MVRFTRSAAEAAQIPHSGKSRPEPACRLRSHSERLSRTQTSPETVQNRRLKQGIANQNKIKLLVISTGDVQNFQTSTDNNKGQKQSGINARENTFDTETIQRAFRYLRLLSLDPRAIVCTSRNPELHQVPWIFLNNAITGVAEHRQRRCRTGAWANSPSSHFKVARMTQEH